VHHCGDALVIGKGAAATSRSSGTGPSAESPEGLRMRCVSARRRQRVCGSKEQERMEESVAIWSLQGEGERERETSPALLHVCAHGSSAGIGSLCCAGGARLLADSADCCLFQRTVLCACTYFKASDAWQLFYYVAMRWVCGQAHGFAHVGVLAAVLCSLCVPALVVVATGDCG